jgi:CelD/BcsL family acetyltransferase involved in cellulose biosynthesis
MIRFKIEDPRWLEFVSAHESATAFHHPEWAALLADCYRYRAFALALDDGVGRIVAGVPVLDVSNRLMGRRWVSLPYTDACPPLIVRAGSAEELVARLGDERKRHGISQFELRWDLPGVERCLSGAVRHVLPLAADPEQTKSGFKPTVRRNVDQALEAGVTIRRADSADDLIATFYGLQVLTRRRQGIPVQPRRYFLRLWQRILEPGLGFCLLAYRGRELVAGAVFLAWKSTVLYKYGASDERHLGLRPNHLLLWEAIRWSCANGYTALDFGRTDFDNQGLRHFKDSWGAREEPLAYSVFGDSARGRPSPARAASTLSSLIRRSPPAVCRAAGELLYRYAA